MPARGQRSKWLHPATAPSCQPSDFRGRSVFQGQFDVVAQVLPFATVVRGQRARLRQTWRSLPALGAHPTTSVRNESRLLRADRQGALLVRAARHVQLALASRMDFSISRAIRFFARPTSARKASTSSFRPDSNRPASLWTGVSKTSTDDARPRLKPDQKPSEDCFTVNLRSADMSLSSVTASAYDLMHRKANFASRTVKTPLRPPPRHRHAQHLQHLCLDLRGVHAGHAVHRLGGCLVDEAVGQHHGPVFQPPVEDRFLGQQLRHM